MEYTPNSKKEKILHFLWQRMPALALALVILIVIVMAARIKSEGERIKQEKINAVKTARPAVNVVVQEIVPSVIRDRIRLPAMIEPWVELKILSEVTGKVEIIKAREGQRLREGDIIAGIDSRDYENAVANHKADYDLAVTALERDRKLYKEDIIPKVTLDESEARAEKFRAALDSAKLMLERCTIKAPMDGILNKLYIEEGQLVGPGGPVAVMLDIERVKAAVGVPESDVDAVRGLREFGLTVDALGGRKFRGRMHFLSINPEDFAHLYRLEIALENPSRELLPGMFANAEIVKKEIAGGISIPLYAVIIRNDEKIIFVEEGGIARARQVETGVLDGWMIHITKGLKAGERVVVVGQRSIEEGQSINVVRAVANPEELLK